MRFQSKTDEQLNDEAMLPEGEYDFTVDKAEERVSKKAKEQGATEPDMIQVDLTIFSPRGDRKIRDWVMEKLPWKLKHFAYAIGLGKEYEAGDLQPTSIVGRSGKLFLKKGKPNGDFAARNEVKDYVVPGSAPQAAAPNATQVPPAASTDDEPPF